MVYVRQTIQDFLRGSKLPLDSTSAVIPMKSTISAIRLESQGPSFTIAGKMNIQENYTNLSMVDQNFNVVTNASSSGLYTGDVSGLVSLKISWDGDPSQIIYALIE